jgi:hypothetical protein
VAIEITGAPMPIESPAFAGVTLRVPLSEQPTSAWLNVLVTQATLPGRGHRVTSRSIDIHLGHTEKDVKKALRDLDQAIAETNEKYDADRAILEQHTPRTTAQRPAAMEKITRYCDEWWTERGGSAPERSAPGLPSPAAELPSRTVQNAPPLA